MSRSNARRPMRLVGAAVTISALLWAGRASAAPSQLSITPAEIQVGMLYRGTQLHVSGTAPEGMRVALVCTGQEGKVELKKKGKVGGLLWMNVGDVAFERVPSVYLASIESGGAAVQPGAAGAGRLGLGFAGLESEVLPAETGEERRGLFRQFLELKQHEGLYGVRNGPSRSGSTVSADFWLPASVPPGTYRVDMIGYRDGASELLGSGDVNVRRVGLAELISSIALRHGLLYGILSVMFALVMGFATGVLFKGSSKGH